MSKSSDSSPNTVRRIGPTPCSKTETSTEGQVDLSQMCPLKDPTCERFFSGALKLDQEVRSKISPKGALGLPPLLDERRLSYGIVDAAFATQPVFERLMVYQLPAHEGETFMEGGRIIAPDTSRNYMRRECPRGILLSAGLGALDAIRSHGIDLGHIVVTISTVPFRLVVDYVDGKPFEVLLMMAGDLVGSEDLGATMRSGEVRVVSVSEDDGPRTHRYEDMEGNSWDPVRPWISGDQ